MTTVKSSRANNSVTTRVLGQRTCDRKIKAVTELTEKAKQKENHGGTTMAVTLRGTVHVVATKLACNWQKDEDATWKKLQQVETHDEGRRQSWSRDSVNEKLVETDEGPRRLAWREHHGNVAVWKDDHDRTMWECESASTSATTKTTTKSDAGAEKNCNISSSCGPPVSQ